MTSSKHLKENSGVYSMTTSIHRLDNFRTVKKLFFLTILGTSDSVSKENAVSFIEQFRYYTKIYT
jgi:hypothetical protein